MTTNDLSSILKELYWIDPSLKKKEAELKKLIQSLLKAKPSVRVSPNFAQKLKRQLLAKADVIEIPAVSFNFSTMLKRWLYPFAGGAVMASLAFAVVIYLRGAQQGIVRPEATSMPARMADAGIISLPTNQAFGPLTDLASPSPSPAQSGGSFGMGGGGVATDEKSMEPRLAEPGFVSNPVIHRYVYKGEPISLSSESVSVYKRKKVEINDQGLTGRFQRLNTGSMDLSTFTDAAVDTVQLVQDQKFGYFINLNFREGYMNLYQNWQQWENPNEKCGFDNDCIERNRLKKEDVPTDDKVIAVAKRFLSEHGVDLTPYGEPVVDRRWEQEGERSIQEGRPVYIPEDIMVAFPLLIEERPVLDEGGQPNGLSVFVNIRHQRVSSVNNLQSELFEKSDYAAVTDWKTVADYLEWGGIGPFAPSDIANADVVEVELGVPEPVMLSLWRGGKGTSDQFFVPGLRFPVIRKPDQGYFYVDNVSVPLAKDLLISPQPLGEPAEKPVSVIIDQIK